MGNHWTSRIKMHDNDREFLKRFSILNTDIQVLYWYYGFLMECPDGMMTVAQAQKYFQDLFYPDEAEAAISNIMSSTALENYETIDYKTFVMLFNFGRIAPKSDKIEWAFKLVDFNGDGLVSRDELATFIREGVKMRPDLVWGLEPEDAPDVAAEIFSRWDYDEDGYLNSDEFITAAYQEAMSLGFIIARI